MLADLELFVTFRWTLATVCTIYAIVVTVKSLWDWLVWFSSSRETAVLGRYTLVLLLRLRLRQFGWEICQILGLVILFMGLVYLHQHTG